MLEGHDAIEYFPRLIEFHQNLKAGILFPSWAPDLSFGLGQPLFLFNPPLIYYLGEFWQLLGFSFVAAMNVACATIVFASALAIFLLGRFYFGSRGGWLAAAALLYAPYFAVDLYVRSAMAEFAAFPFLAFALLGFATYAKTKNQRALLGGALAYAAVIWCHLPAALIFSPLLAAFLLFSRRAIGAQFLGIALGLALAAAVWIPALALRGDIHVERLLDGSLRYSNHFVYPAQLFSTHWGYGLSIPGTADDLSFSLGWPQILLVGIAIVVARKSTVFFAISAAILCLLMLPESAWLWDRVRLLQYIQFPWRLLQPASLLIALAIASLGRFKIPIAAAALALLIVPNLSHLKPRSSRPVDLSLWTPAMIAERGILVSTSAEYSPRWVEIAPRERAPFARVVRGSADLYPGERTPVSWSAAIVAKQPSRVRVSIAYFPGWRIQLDDRSFDAQPEPTTGDIAFDIPPGDHRVTIAFTRTPIVWFADALSAAAMAAILFLARSI